MRTPCSFNERRTSAARARPFARAALLLLLVAALPVAASADRLRLADGSSIEVDEAWEDAQGVWYRRGGVTHLVERGRVRSIERTTSAGATMSVAAAAAAPGVVAANNVPITRAPAGDAASSDTPERTLWIHLVGGAKMEVDEATEMAEGVWYVRGPLNVFIERSRVERVERDSAAVEGMTEVAVSRRTRRERAWTTGSARLDGLIRQNGARFGVDPYLIFCVMEQESHFNARALSPKGASGLMQLMPGTAARFGVRDPRDPAQNVMGGTRYLKELLRRFDGRVDLVLAGYNAGEGAVMKYGRRVPPYRETRNYVRRISARYQRGN